MPNVSPKIQRHAFTMRVDDQFEDRLDELRSMLKPVPSKSDAVRIAIDMAVKALSPKTEEAWVLKPAIPAIPAIPEKSG